jgi:hypothetical protein
MASAKTWKNWKYGVKRRIFSRVKVIKLQKMKIWRHNFSAKHFFYIYATYVTMKSFQNQIPKDFLLCDFYDLDN